MSALRTLAHSVGVLTEHVDGLGAEVTVSDATLVAILRSLGVDIERADEADAVLEARQAQPPPVLPPCVVVQAGDADACLWAHLPRGAAEVEITCESGESMRRDVELTAPAGAQRLPVGSLLPGYHEIAVRHAGASHRSLILARPGPCFGRPDPRAARRWGIFAPVYALRSAGSVGVGDLGDLRRLMTWAGSHGASFVGTLPLLAGNYREAFEPSPYSPVSRLFWNELYLDHRRLSADMGRPLPRSEVPEPGLIDYRTAADAKRDILARLANAAWAEDGTRAQLEAFVNDRHDIDDYARFRAHMERVERPWPEWSEGARDGRLERQDVDESAWRYHVFAQWALEEELASLGETGVGLYMDLPVGVNGHSYDVWRHSEAFVTDVTVGAPPDGLFEGGQNWALPPLHPERIRELGHRYFARAIRAHMRHSSMLRIDHVMGLHRLYWVPAGMPATDGAYVTYPAEELYAILEIESARARCAVVGEDLGTVPDYVRPAMDRHGLYRIFVAQFAAEEQGGRLRPVEPPPGSVASLDTHDTPTFAAFADQAGLDGDRWDLLRRWHADLAESEVAAVLVNLEDLWLERSPQNVPGSTDVDHPNWRRRMARDLATIEKDAQIAELLAEVDAARRASKRGT